MFLVEPRLGCGTGAVGSSTSSWRGVNERANRISANVRARSENVRASSDRVQTKTGPVRFHKKQQWVTTNYVVLIYAAITWYAHHVELSSLLSCVLSTITIVTGLIATGILVSFQYDLGELRESTNTANKAFFSKEERDSLSLREYRHPYARGWHVLAALILVCVVGAILVIFVLISPARSVV